MEIYELKKVVEKIFRKHYPALVENQPFTNKQRAMIEDLCKYIKENFRKKRSK